MITEAFIHEMLDNAKDNGYDFSEAAPTTVAEDMSDLIFELEEAEIHLIIPHVITWQKVQHGTP